MPFQVRGRDYAQPIPIGMIPPYQSPMMQPSIWGQTLGNPQLQNVLMNIGSSMLMAGAPAPVSAGPPGWRLAQGMAGLPGQMQQFQQFQNEQERFRLGKAATERELQKDLQTEEGQRAMAEALQGFQSGNPMIDSMVGAFSKNPLGMNSNVMATLMSGMYAGQSAEARAASQQLNRDAADERARLNREAADRRAGLGVASRENISQKSIDAANQREQERLDAQARLQKERFGHEIGLTAGREALRRVGENAKTQKALSEHETFTSNLFTDYMRTGGAIFDQTPRLAVDFLKVNPDELTPQNQLKYKLMSSRAQAYNADPTSRSSLPYVGQYYRMGNSFIVTSQDGSQVEDAGPGLEGAISAVQMLPPNERRNFLAGGDTMVKDPTTGLYYTYDRKWRSLRNIPTSMIDFGR